MNLSSEQVCAFLFLEDTCLHRECLNVNTDYVYLSNVLRRFLCLFE